MPDRRPRFVVFQAFGAIRKVPRTFDDASEPARGRGGEGGEIASEIKDEGSPAPESLSSDREVG